jgi:ketosteroid isomerase-like protein
MRAVFTVTVFLTLSIVLNAQQPGVHADANPIAEGEIKALELKMAELIVRGDWDEYANHLASDYLHIRENGHVENKDEAIANLRGVQGNVQHDAKRKIIIMEMESTDLAMHIYGDTAVSSAEFTITVRNSGQVTTHLTRETDIFVKHDGQWLLVAGQDAMVGK